MEMEMEMENQNTAIHQLVKGRDFTAQLKHLLFNTTTTTAAVTTPTSQSDDQVVTTADHHRGSAADLVDGILSSFTRSLSILNSFEKGDSDEGFPPPHHHSLDGRKSSDSSSGDKTNRSTTRARRKASPRSPEWWVKESATLVDDGHAWRKYGQKKIISSEFPKHYYRCTHKTDQNCPATKQVQLITNDNSPPDQLIYRTTYHRRHTCVNHHRRHLFLQQDDDDLAGCHVISFSAQVGQQRSQHNDDVLSGGSFLQVPATAAGLERGSPSSVHVAGATAKNGSTGAADHVAHQGAASSSSSSFSAGAPLICNTSGAVITGYDHSYCDDDGSNFVQMMMTRMESVEDFDEIFASLT